MAIEGADIIKAAALLGAGLAIEYVQQLRSARD